MSKDKIDKMVDRFLSWNLPRDFDPDCGINYFPPVKGSPDHFFPTGTNLLNADQEREMILHVLADESA